MSAAPNRRTRLGRVAILSTIALGTAIAACNGIAQLDEVKYSLTPDATLPDGAPIGDGGSRTVRDSSYEAQAQPPPLEFDAAPLGQCEGGIADPEALCDHNAGLGCCIHSTAGTSECMHQLDFAKYCLGQAADSVFVSCIKSSDGNECCWRKDDGPGGTNRFFATYSESCTKLGVPMVCSETADCPLNQVCNFPSKPCHTEIKIGLCGAAGAPGPVCP